MAAAIVLRLNLLRLRYQTVAGSIRDAPRGKSTEGLAVFLGVGGLSPSSCLILLLASHNIISSLYPF